MEQPKHNYYDYEAEQHSPHYPYLPPQDEPRAVFVDTSLNTHLAVLISPLQTFSALKQQISLEHFNFFPKFGRIMIKDIMMGINGNNYLLPDTMLIKSAFCGVENVWAVCAEVWTPVGSLELANRADVRHIKPSHQNCIPKRVEPSPECHHEPKLLIPPQPLKHVVPPSQYHHDPKYIHSSDQNYKPRHVEPFSQHPPETRHLTSSHQNDKRPSSQEHQKHPIEPSSQLQETPNTSGKKNKKKKRKKNEKEMDNVDEKTNAVSNTKSQDKKSVEEQLDEKTEKQGEGAVSNASKDTGTEHLNKPGEGHHDASVMLTGDAPNASQKKKRRKKNKNAKDMDNLDEKTTVVSNTGSQDKKFVEEQPDENTEKQVQRAVSNAGKDIDTKHLNKPGDGHYDTSVMLMEDASDKIVTDLQGNSTNLAENFNKENENLNFESPLGTQATKSKKKKKGGIDAVTQSHPSTPVKGPAILEKGDAPSNNGTTINNSEQIGIETGGEASPAQWDNAPEPLSQHVPLNSENTSKKRKANESDQESRKTSEKILSSQLNDVLELLSQDDIKESSKTVEREKEIVEDVAPLKLENTAKKRKTNKAKSSSPENQGWFSTRPNDDEKADGTKLSQPEDSVETINAKVKKSRSRKVVPEDAPGSPVKEKPDDAIKEMATPITVFESDKSKKKSQKKQPVPSEHPSNIVDNQHLDETMTEKDVPVKVDDTSTKCDANDALLKSENAGKSRKANDSDVVSLSLLNDHSKLVLSQDKSPNLIEKEKEKEIKEDVAPSKSENTAKKRKSKARSCGTENQELSSRRQNEDEKTDDGSKVSGANIAMEMDAPKRDGLVERADDVMIDGKSSDAENQNAVKQGEEHANFSQNPDLDTSAVVDEVPQFEKPLASKKTKKPDQASSIDTSSTKHNLVGSKKSRGSAKTSEPQVSNTVQKQDKSTPKELVDSKRNKSSKASSVNTVSKVTKIYQDEEAKKPLNKLEGDGSLRRSSRLTSREVSNTLEKQSGWAVGSSERIFNDGNNSNSDDEDGSDAPSPSATVLPEDSNDSTDDSEVESGDTVKSKGGSHKGNGSIKAQSSIMNLESILKSSRRYMKAKLAASQSQGESEPPDFVPESQGI